VREMFERVAAGESVRSVAAWVASLPSDAREQRSLDFSMVRRLLRSPLYIARPYEHPEANMLARPIGRWSALVDDVTFRRAQERIDGHAHTPHQATGRYLLSGLLRCPRCGGRMSGGNHQRGPRYRCQQTNLGASAVDATCRVSLKAPALDAVLLAQVAEVLDAVSLTPVLQTSLLRAWERLRQGSGGAEHGQRLGQVEQVAERARGRIKRAALLFVDGQLDKAGYDLARVEAERDLEAAESQLARLQSLHVAPALPPLEEVQQAVGTWRAALNAGDISAQREVLAALIETLTVDVKRPGQYCPRITWTPTGQALARLTARAGVAA
jgi:site-specific DNA recombinase